MSFKYFMLNPSTFVKIFPVLRCFLACSEVQKPIFKSFTHFIVKTQLYTVNKVLLNLIEL